MLRYETSNGRAVITIDDLPRRNPLSTDTMVEIRNRLAEAATDDAIRVIVITGAGDRVFSAGGDLSGGFVDSPLASHGKRAAFADMFREMRASGKPVVARVNGHALAGGFGLAVGCDLVVAVEGATFGATEINVGLWPMMISAILTRIMPRKVAFDLVLTGRRISAVEAMRLGVVSRVVPTHDDLDAAVDEIVEAVKGLPAGVIAIGKSAFYGAEDLPLDAALDLLHTGLTGVAMTDDAREGVSAFIEKRLPEWTGR